MENFLPHFLRQIDQGFHIIFCWGDVWNTNALKSAHKGVVVYSHWMELGPRQEQGLEQ